MSTTRNNMSQSGFTLVELAVVLLIIGLIVGGILRGQELITSAQLNSVQTDANQIRTATNTFRDKFQALPGDLSDPSILDTSELSFDLTEDNGGNGNGRIDNDRVATPGSDQEAASFWLHLGAAGLLGTVSTENLNGTELSATNGFAGSVGGFWTIGQGLPNGNFDNVSNRDAWLVLGTTGDGASNNANDGTIVNAADAAQLDRKVDDGEPLSGDLRGTDDGDGNCTATDGAGNTSTTSYNTGEGNCALGLRL